MPVQLPNLDDRRWADLVEEGRSLIPFYAPDWTDHNLHDPGITLLELFAWLAEMDLFQLNQIPETHQRKFLNLIGLHPTGPRPAETILAFTLKETTVITDAADLPATVEFESDDPLVRGVRFGTLDPLHVVTGNLQKLLIIENGISKDVSEQWRRGEAFGAFGRVPMLGSELRFGFTAPLPAQRTVQLYFQFDNEKSRRTERKRLWSEMADRERACAHPCPPCNSETHEHSESPDKHPLGPDPSARVIWEFFAQGLDGGWQELRLDKNEVLDHTRSFTFDGYVQIRIPRSMKVQDDGLYYLRARFKRGQYDSTPQIRIAAFNAVRAQQAVPIGTATWTIAKGVQAGGTPVSPGTRTGIDFKLNQKNEISELFFVTDEMHPDFLVLKYQEATMTSTGILSIEACILGEGNGFPEQKFTLPAAPVLSESFRLYTVESEQWRLWNLKSDFDSSQSADFHFVLDNNSGEVLFGNGDKGRAVPVRALILVSCMETKTQDGNVAAGKISYLSQSAHNKAILKSFSETSSVLSAISNVAPANGGAAAEQLDHAKGRALELMQATTRAITVGDYETLAKETPGVRLARVQARANYHPAVPCFCSPGVVTVIVVPPTPVAKPIPSAFLLKSVRSYLSRRRTIGTRVEVIGPIYIDLRVKAVIQASSYVDKTILRQRVIGSLNAFFDPLVGGPDHNGWPFGREVYRSEVMQVINDTPGVAHTTSVDLVLKDGQPRCANVCIPTNGLIAAGLHEIEIV